MSRARILALKVLAVPVVVVVVLAGIWATGALLTNDFRLAMLLTAAWMGLAGLLALVIAARSRLLRWPVLGAYAVTAAAAGLYLGSSMFLDNEVDERVAVAAAPAVAASSQAEPAGVDAGAAAAPAEPA
jgi:hypothetical protein